MIHKDTYPLHKKLQELLSPNIRQRLMIEEFSNGLPRITSPQWAKICNCSRSAAIRDIRKLIKKDFLRKSLILGRSTCYRPNPIFLKEETVKGKKRCKECHELKPSECFENKKYCSDCKRDKLKMIYKNKNKDRHWVGGRYELTPKQYLFKLKKQKYKCAICDKRLFNNRATHIDHCHKTNKVRDVLCWQCNMLLGIVKDDINVINKYIDYLNKHS